MYSCEGHVRGCLSGRGLDSCVSCRQGLSFIFILITKHLLIIINFYPPKKTLTVFRDEIKFLRILE